MTQVFIFWSDGTYTHIKGAHAYRIAINWLVYNNTSLSDFTVMENHKEKAYFFFENGNEIEWIIKPRGCTK